MIPIFINSWKCIGQLWK